MINKKDILKMVRHVSKRSRGIPDRRLIHPTRDWLIGLGVFSLVAIVGVIYNMQVYSRYNNIESELATPTSGVVTYKENLVAETLEFYRTKKRLYEERLGQSVQIEVPDAAVDDREEDLETVISEEEGETEVVSTDEEDVAESELIEESEEEPADTPEPVFN